MSPPGRDDEALPVTVLLPDDPAQPTVLYDGGAALRMAVVDRDGAQALAADPWDAPGVYLLLDRPDTDGTWGCYAGKATSLRVRLRQHLGSKDHWRRALLVQRDTTFGFNSAQIGWLEGRLYDLLDAAEQARLHNGNRPSDETLPPHERLVLEAAVAPVRRVLRLIGHDPASPDDTAGSVLLRAAAPSGAHPPAPRTRSSRFAGITLADLLRAGLVQAGDRFVSTNAVWPADGVLQPDGALLVDGTRHPTPSAAAYAVKNGNANGWEFWALEQPQGRVSLATLRARYAESAGNRPPDP